MPVLQAIADQFGGVFECCRHLLHMHTPLFLNSLCMYVSGLDPPVCLSCTVGGEEGCVCDSVCACV